MKTCETCKHYIPEGAFGPILVTECTLDNEVSKFHGFVNLERFLTFSNKQNFCFFYENDNKASPAPVPSDAPVQE